MMAFIDWVALTGLVLLVIGLASAYLKPLPISSGVIFLLIGVGIGPLGLGLLDLNTIATSNWLERLTEVVVIVSLFVGGLKLRLPLRHKAWVAAYRLAGPVMLLCIAGVALVGHYLLGLTPAAALLLGAVLAPTDPVLASEVAVEDASDRDRLRYGLSGEAGLNDGTAFPFVVFALLLIEHQGRLGGWVGEWALERLLWAVPAGLLLGGLMGWGVGRLAFYLRSRNASASSGDFLALALIALAYAGAEFIHAWGFLAAFAAGVGLRQAEVQTVRRNPPDAVPPAPAAVDLERQPAEQLVRHPMTEEMIRQPAVASGAVVHEVLTFGQTLERLLATFTIILVGVLASVDWDWRGLVLAGLLFFLIRPLAVWVGLLGTPTTARQRLLMGWFGIRGIGTLYYLGYAIGEGVGRSRAVDVTGLAVTVVAASIVLHGVSSTPLLNWYHRSLEASPGPEPD
ncbi:K(+)/H(+) antiporter NhaP [Calidithermus terrae]|uniref:K(+)/H(+) antiporter NhaP n=1 Tax=Calidithermus terrae TaxID=1408545 RepID=A0A399F415_9DEIN|nr:cation:proton antiporter [Calidithermus terrae]RIH90396.1 K(+)/H(+) antiporter NhaP [Calidithermus terrae]